MGKMLYHWGVSLLYSRGKPKCRLTWGATCNLVSRHQGKTLEDDGKDKEKAGFMSFLSGSPGILKREKSGQKGVSVDVDAER